MSHPFLGRSAIVDIIKSKERTNAIQKREGLTDRPVRFTVCTGARIRTAGVGIRSKWTELFLRLKSVRPSSRLTTRLESLRSNPREGSRASSTYRRAQSERRRSPLARPSNA